MGATFSPAALLEKITITGTLRLQSPLRIGSGEGGAREADIYVLKDGQGCPILPGSSLAGALRAAVTDADELFGCAFGDNAEEAQAEEIRQSSLSVADVRLEHAAILARDGIRIDHRTGTAAKGAKFDYETVAPGASGELSIIVTLREYQKDRKESLEAAVEALARQLACGIRVGSMGTKGFGWISCDHVRLSCYDFARPDAVKAWLLHEPCRERAIDGGAGENGIPRDRLAVDAWFSINNSLLVRQASQEPLAELPVAFRQMRCRDANGNTRCIVPGTALKGVLRQQARRILDVLRKKGADALLASLMGAAGEQKSRFRVEDAPIQEGAAIPCPQARNKIDRFTGGVARGHLFAEEPLWQVSGWQDGKGDGLPRRREPAKEALRIHFEIWDCKPWEAGLGLFLLKDLWRGSVAVGGGKSVGRGTLAGCRATIRYTGEGMGKEWQLDREGRVLGENALQDMQDMEKCASALLAPWEE